MYSLTPLRNTLFTFNTLTNSNCNKCCQGVDPMTLRIVFIWHLVFMMTSSNGNIVSVTGHLCGEFTGPRWIARTKPVTRSFDVFFDLHLNKLLSKQSWGWWFETLSRPLWRHRNVQCIVRRCLKISSFFKRMSASFSPIQSYLSYIATDLHSIRGQRDYQSMC